MSVRLRITRHDRLARDPSNTLTEKVKNRLKRKQNKTEIEVETEKPHDDGKLKVTKSVFVTFGRKRKGGGGVRTGIRPLSAF